MAKDRFITGLDVGTSNICALVGKVDRSGEVELVGEGLSESAGIRGGSVLDLDEASASISKAMREAEKTAALELYSVFLNITGSHLCGYNRQGMINLPNREKGISSRHINEVINYAKALPILLDQEPIHTIPQYYVVNDQDDVKNPLGMVGERLTAAVHIIVGSVAQRQNLTRCVNRAGFEVEGVVSESLAASYAVLNREEKELGVILVNMGGGTTDIIIFDRGVPWYTAVLPIGALQLTEMISKTLKTSIDSAEDIKKRYGSALPSMVKADVLIMVPGISGRPQRNLSSRSLAELIGPEMKKILSQVAAKIEESGYRQRTTSGVVITGGGTLLQGTIEMAESVLDLPIKLGLACEVKAATNLLSNPLFTTAIGLIRYGAELKQKESRLFGRGMMGRVLGRVRDWIQEYL